MRLPPVYLFLNFFLEKTSVWMEVKEVNIWFAKLFRQWNKSKKTYRLLCLNVVGKENICKGFFLGKVKVICWIATVQLLVKYFISDWCFLLKLAIKLWIYVCKVMSIFKVALTGEFNVNFMFDYRNKLKIR